MYNMLILNVAHCYNSVLDLDESFILFGNRTPVHYGISHAGSEPLPKSHCNDSQHC